MFRNMRYERISFEEVVKNSINVKDATRNLGLKPSYGNRKTVKCYIDRYNIDTTHFFTPVRGQVKRKTLEEILVVNSTYTHTTNLKNMLYRVGLKFRICELCGQDEVWNGRKLSLILDHINGVNNDNRIENLRIVCPNCNATLETHGGRNIKNALMMELVVMPDSKSGVERRVGSTPTEGTNS